MHFPPSDAERLDFERLVIPHLEKRFRRQAPPPNIPPRIASNIPLELLKKIYSYNRTTALDITTSRRRGKRHRGKYKKITASRKPSRSGS